jgi:PhzF family phenazine biosynthesis protein
MSDNHLSACTSGTFPDVLRYAAFTQNGKGGNPAGVVLEAAGLNPQQRLAVAAEVGYSETAFLEQGPSDGAFRVRYFSPRAEVAFCGHATVAAAVAVAERRGPGDLLFETLAGPVPVRTQAAATGYTATLTSAPTRTRPAAAEELAAALDALHWQHSDLDETYPPHVAYAGNEHLILAAHDRARLADLDYDYDSLADVMHRRGWTTVHLVHAQTPLLFSARHPFPPGGVVEDPATGAAAAAFGGYLRALGLVKPPALVTVLQGEDMGSPSRLLVHVTPGERVEVTGTAAALPA